MTTVQDPLRTSQNVNASGNICRMVLTLAAMTLVLGLAAAPAAAQQPAQPAPLDSVRADTTRRALVNADSLLAATQDGRRIQRLIGRVRVLQDSTRLRSNRAIRYLDRRSYLFIGDVVIIERGDTLRANRVRYDERRKIGRAEGNVRLSDGEVRVQAPSGVYYANEKRSQFENGVTLIDSTSTLESARGAYFSEDKRAEFYGNVRFRDRNTYLEADSVTYFRESGATDARGQVSIERYASPTDEVAADSTTRTLLFGRRARSRPDSSYSRVEGKALLVRLRADSAGTPTDTLLVQARQMETFRTDALRRFTATDAVRIWQPTLAAVADSAVFDRTARDTTVRRDESRLYRAPVVWFERSQVMGDTMQVVGYGGGIDTLRVRSEAFAAQLDTTLSRIQQLKGRRLRGYFRQDSLRTLAAGPNARAIWHLSKENDAPNGATKASGDRIVLHFEGGDVQRVRVLSGVQSTYFSEENMPASLKLEGFRWTPDRRPTKDAFLRRDRVLEWLRRDAALARAPTSPPSPSLRPSPRPLPPSPKSQQSP